MGWRRTGASLIASRAAQGAGAALLSPAALSIVTTSYAGEQRARALSTWGAIGGAGAAAGVLLGGILTTWLGWRSVFFVNVPTGLATAAIAVRASSHRGHATPASRGAAAARPARCGDARHGSRRPRLRRTGGAAAHGWGSVRNPRLLAAAAGLLAGFATIERRAPHALIAPSIWRLRSLVSSASVMLGVTAILVGTSFLNTLFFQNVLGDSALKTGLEFLPGILTVGVAAHLGPKLLIRFGSRAVIVAGLALAAAGDLLLSAAPPDAAYLTDLLPGFLLLGLGVGFAFVSISVSAMSDVGEDQAGVASGLITTAHDLGAAAGVSIFSAVAFGSGAAGGAGLVTGYGLGMPPGRRSPPRWRWSRSSRSRGCAPR